MNWHMNLYFQRVDVKKPLLIKGLIIIIGGAVLYLTTLLVAVTARVVGFHNPSYPQNYPQKIRVRF